LIFVRAFSWLGDRLVESRGLYTVSTVRMQKPPFLVLLPVS